MSAEASQMEIKAAYRKLVAEVQERYDDATDLTTRRECSRKRRELDEARRTLILNSDDVPDFEDQEQRRREEEERREAEQRQREEQERQAAEQRRREEQERQAAEQRQREEQERLAAEQRQREEKERRDAEQRQREEQERREAEQRQRQEQERRATEQRKREEQERRATEQRKREEQERRAAEQRLREEQERLAREQREREEKKRRATIRLLIGGLVLLLAAVFAAGYFFWVDWQNHHKLGKLVLNTLPANAGVFVDGISRGTTPLVLDGVIPGERQLRIELEGYQDEELIVLIEPGDQRFFPLVTLIPKKEPVSTVTPAPTSPTVSPAPTAPTVTPAPTSPSVTPAPTLSTVTPAPSGFPGERFPQTRLRILTEAEVANLDYDDLQYAINEMYARHAAQFIKDPDVRKQFESFSWYYPMPGMTLSRIDREFSRIESQNRDLLARLRNQKRHK